MEAWIASLGSAASGLTAALAVALSAAALGGAILRAWSPLAPRHPLERVLVAFSVGSIVLSLTMLGIGVVRLPPASLTVAALAVGSLAAIRSGLRALRRSPALGRRLSDPRALACALLLAGPVLPGAACAPVGWDDLVYHVELPLRWWARGHVGVLTDNPYSGFPSAVELLFVPAVGAGGILAPGVLTVLAWLAAAGLLYRLLRRRLGAIPAYGVTLTIAWSHLGFMIAGESYAEPWLALHLLALVASVGRGPGRGGAETRARQGLPTGVLLGGAVATKLTGGAFVAVAALLAGRRLLSIATVTAALTALLVAGPFLLRPALSTGNPFHPFAARFFLPDDEAAIATAQHHHALAVEPYGRRGPLGALLALGELATAGDRYSGHLGRQWWLLLGLAAAGALRPGRPRRLLLGAALLFAAWYSSAQQARFLWPAVMLVGLCAGAGLGRLPRRARTLAAVALVAVAVAEVPRARWWQVWSATQRVLGVGEAPSRATWIHTGTGRDLLPAMAALHELSPAARVLLIGEPRGAYCPRDHEIGTPWFQAARFTPPERVDAKALLEELDRGRFTHLLFGEPLRDPDRHPSTRDGRRLLLRRAEELVTEGALAITWSSPTHRLFERRPEADGMR